MTLKRLTVLPPVAVALAALLPSAAAHATVWWPEVASVSNQMSVYRDYDDAALFYFVPKQVQIATQDSGVKMISHEIFFNRLAPSRSFTQYNLTFEPVLESDELQSTLHALQAKFGGNARLVPMPVTTMSFEVTQKFEASNAQGSTPFTVYVPSWTGDLHSFHQRFSMVMTANPYMAEPAMSRFVTDPAGNALVGTLHYGFRGAQTPFEGHAKVNVHQFVSKLKAQLSARYSFWASVDVSTAIDKIKDDKSVFIQVKKDKGYESEVWKSLVAKLIDQVFEPMPTAPNAPETANKGFSLVKLRTEYSSVTLDREITIDLKETLVTDHSGDVDIAGGGVRPEQLSSNLKYLCDMWAHFDLPSNRCVNVCEPALEYYNPATKTCAPAFGGAQ